MRKRMMCLTAAGLLFGAALPVAAQVVTPKHALPKTASEELLAFGVPDLGASHPAAPNVSLDPRFAVYRWVRDGVQVFQINTAQGQVISTFALGQHLTRLPFGSYTGGIALVTDKGVEDDEADEPEAAGQ